MAVIGTQRAFVHILGSATVALASISVTLCRGAKSRRAIRGHQTRHAGAKARVATAPTARDVVINAAHGDVDIVAIAITITSARAVAGPVYGATIVRGATQQSGVDAAIIVAAATNAAVAAANWGRGVVPIDPAIGVLQAILASVAAIGVLALLVRIGAVIGALCALVNVGATHGIEEFTGQPRTGIFVTRAVHLVDHVVVIMRWNARVTSLLG